MEGEVGQCLKNYGLKGLDYDGGMTTDEKTIGQEQWHSGVVNV